MWESAGRRCPCARLLPRRPLGLAQEMVTLNLSTAQLRSLDAGPGRWLRLWIAPEAIQIMPQKVQAR